MEAKVVFDYIKRNDHSNLYDYIAALGPIKIHNEYGESALCCAIHNESRDCMQLLIKLGSDVNEQNSDVAGIGDTCLIAAVRKGNNNLVEDVIAAGGNVNLKSREGKTPLLVCVELQNCTVLQTLLKAEAVINEPCIPTVISPNMPHYCDFPGITPFILSCFLNSSQICEYLLSQNADMCAKLASDTNALLCASFARNSKVVELLCQHGMNVNSTDRKRNTALMLTLNPNLSWVLEMWQREYLHTCVYQYRHESSHDELRTCQRLLHWGIDIGKENNCGEDAVDTFINFHTDTDIDMKVEDSKSCGKTLRTDMLKLLVAAGGNVKNEQTQYEWIKQVAVQQEKYSLREACRNAVRKYLMISFPRSNLFWKCSRLPLPEVLQSWIVHDMTIYSNK